LFVSRYHAIELAILLEKQFFALGYQNKCLNLIRDFGFENSIYSDLRTKTNELKIHEYLNIYSKKRVTENIIEVKQNTILETLEQLIR